MKRSGPVSLALVALFVSQTGCTSYKVIPIGEVAEHGKVRVTLISGHREILRDPWIEGDSIKGESDELVDTLGPRVHLPPAVYALEEVAGVEAAGTDEVGTVFTVLGFAAVIAIVACVAACQPLQM